MTDQSRTFLRLNKVLERTGLKRATIYALAKRGEFPKPVKLTGKASGWLESEVDTWIESRLAERSS